MNKILKSKKGLSAVVTTVILVALSMAAVVLVWVFVNNMIKGQIKNTESCFGNYDKVTINRQYTCYDSTDEVLRFSLMVGEINVEKVIVSVSSANAVKSFAITNFAQTIPGLVMNSGADPEQVVLPEKNAGLTYNATGFNLPIDQIKIAPVVGGTQCDVSDSLSEIDECQL